MSKSLDHRKSRDWTQGKPGRAWQDQHRKQKKNYPKIAKGSTRLLHELSPEFNHQHWIKMRNKFRATEASR